MYCVGLTGNIASGKSTALAYFASLGITTISADAIAKQITTTEPSVLTAIRTYFGKDVFLDSGELNRSALRSIIFSDAEKRRWLESLLHPLIKQQIQRDIAQAKPPYCVIEIPLLFDKKNFPYINRVLLITCNQNTALRRIMERDNCSQEAAQAILNTQPNPSQRRAIADDIVENNNGASLLHSAIEALHKQYDECGVEKK